jgi:FixJ family two-component response regulator
LNPIAKVSNVCPIDDDESMRISLMRILGKLGYLAKDYVSANVFLEKSSSVLPGVILGYADASYK